MNRKFQLGVILCAVLILTALISHSLIVWLKVEIKTVIPWEVGQPGGEKPSVFLAGSSLAADGIAWDLISKELKLGIEGWQVAGSTPSEWEPFQNRARQAVVTILVVSPYDLNEYILCDFRPQVVPLSRTIKDLWQCRADWSFSERLLRQYPLTYLRLLFPTTGRSVGVMLGASNKLKFMLGGMVNLETEAGPTIAFNEIGSKKETKTEKIIHWSPGRMMRRVASMRSGCQGRQAFNGPKKLAFLRMLRTASVQGTTIVVVLPVSPVYEREFLTPEVKREFEETLMKFKEPTPQTYWIRIDQVDALNTNDFFKDLVHMNTDGRKIATQAFLCRLKEFKIFQ